jgi:hypothetical protein
MNVTAKKNQINMDLGSQFSMAHNGCGWVPGSVPGPTAVGLLRVSVTPAHFGAFADLFLPPA